MLLMSCWDVFSLRLGRFRVSLPATFQYSFPMCFWCRIFQFLTEFNRKWEPILWAGTTHFRVFFGTLFYHWFWMDFGSILEPLRVPFGRHLASEEATLRTFLVMICHNMLALVSTTYFLLFWNYFKPFLSISNAANYLQQCSNSKGRVCLYALRSALSLFHSLYLAFVDDRFRYDQSSLVFFRKLSN